MNWHGEIISACVQTWQCAPFHSTTAIPVGRMITAEYDNATLLAFTTNATAERLDLARTGQLFNTGPEDLQRAHPELEGLIQRVTTAQVCGLYSQNVSIGIPGVVPAPHTRMNILSLPQTKEIIQSHKTLLGLLRIVKECDGPHALTAFKILLKAINQELPITQQEREALGRAFAEIYHLEYTIVESFILFLENL